MCSASQARETRSSSSITAPTRSPGSRLEDDAVALGLVERGADRGAPRTLEIEGLQPDARLLAELEGGKAGIGIHGQALPRHLVEHRAAAMPARQLDETPDQLRHAPSGLPIGSNKAIQERPRLRVHQEGVAIGGKQQALVAHPHEVGVGQRLRRRRWRRRRASSPAVGSGLRPAGGARQQPDRDGRRRSGRRRALPAGCAARSP